MPACCETAAASRLQAGTGGGQGQRGDKRKEAPGEAGNSTRADVTGASDRFSFQSPSVSINNRLPRPGKEERGAGRRGHLESGWGGMTCSGQRLRGTHSSSQARTGRRRMGRRRAPGSAELCLPASFSPSLCLPHTYSAFHLLSEARREGRQDQFLKWKRIPVCEVASVVSDSLQPHGL